MIRNVQLLLLVLVVLFLTRAGLGQVPTGTPPFGSFGGGPFDAVNLGNLNLHFAIPAVNKAGRGMPFTYSLSYDSSVWYPVTSNGTTSWQPVGNWGWRGDTEIATGYVSYSVLSAICPGTTPSEGLRYYTYTTFVYHDPFGTPHRIAGTDFATLNWPQFGCLIWPHLKR